MAYGSNILKRDAAYYDLHNASIVNGILTIEAGGYATQIITVSDLPLITSKMLFTAIADPYSDHYSPRVYAKVVAKCSDGIYHEAIMYPNDAAGDVYSCEFSLKDGEYSYMAVTIGADEDTTFSLWELCAEAADESTIVEIEGVKQALVKLLYDYNTGIFSGSTEEATIAFITCRLLQNTDVQGHFVFTFSNTHPCCMTIRFYDNDSEELFSPLYYDLKAGNNSIGIPHAFLSRLAGIHSFYVTAQVSQGTFTVPVRGALFTIDAGYLATRELSIAMDITDIAIRQLSADNGPNEIWAIGLDKGIAYVRSRKYAEENANVGWTAVGSLGTASAAAIEFDGNWVLRPEAEQYTIETEEEPWYFWVNDSTLYGHKGFPNELDPPIVLDTGVLNNVKAVKGYSSIDYPWQDQGLVVIYNKLDGYVYYRAFAYSVDTGSKRWEDPIQIQKPSGMYQYANIHRLNDYRLAISLSGSTDNLWLLTDRTYVGQSAYPERCNTAQIFTDEDCSEPFLTIYPASYEAPVPEVTFVSQDTYTITDSGQEQVHYRFYAKLAPAMYASEAIWSLYDRFEFNGINKDSLEDVQWTHTSGFTEITLVFSEAPTSLLVTITIKANTHLRLYDGQYVSEYKDAIPMVWDTTNYISYTASDDASVALQLASVSMRNKQLLSASVDDNEHSTLSGSATCTISRVAYGNAGADDNYSNSLDASVNLHIYDSQDVPV